MPTRDPLVLVWVYPSVLGTYGDGGNVRVLAARASDRDIPVSVVTVDPFEPVPSLGDIYVLGGAEDAAQATAAEALRRNGGIHAAVARGAVVFAVCAGFQLLGDSFPALDGVVAGLGLLDATTRRLPHRAVGELLARSAPDTRLPVLTGYENHASGTTLGPQARPLGLVEAGIGNGDGTEGARQGNIVATYLHGPALVRNPALADLLLELVVGPLPPLPDPLVDRLREERIAAARTGADRPRSTLEEIIEQLRRRRT